MNIAQLCIAAIFLLGLMTAESSHRAADPVPRPTAKQIFALVDYVEANPHVNRAQAEAFLQKLLDGKIRFLSKAPTESTAKLPCYRYRHGKSPCVECDAAQENCWGTLCCLAGPRR